MRYHQLIESVKEGDKYVLKIDGKESQSSNEPLKKIVMKLGDPDFTNYDVVEVLEAKGDVAVFCCFYDTKKDDKKVESYLAKHEGWKVKQHVVDGKTDTLVWDPKKLSTDDPYAY